MRRLVECARARSAASSVSTGVLPTISLSA
jgi:hypothetical protein